MLRLRYHINELAIQEYSNMNSRGLSASVTEDTRAFCEDVRRFVSGDMTADEFRPRRAVMGIYEQREYGTYMLRVRCAAGVILPDQARLVASLAREYSSGMIHCTTRQDLQIHGVAAESLPDMLERLLDVGISCRGGGGDAVRNVAACPGCGAFDVTHYALAVAAYMSRDRANYKLPRKFKIAFSGCSSDCALASVADLGFFARVRDGVRGFSVYAGGGMGSRPAVGVLVEDFVLDSSVFEIVEAMKRFFDAHGDRTNRSRARLRHVVERVGADEFLSLYRGELEHVKSEKIEYPKVELAPAPASDTRAVRLSFPSGNLTPDQLERVADLAETGDGMIRATQDEELLLRLPAESIASINPELIARGFVRAVACVGSHICRLGIRNSPGVARAIEEALQGMGPVDGKIKISGCPNSCGQHLTAPVGLCGAAKRVDDRQVPSYTVFVGGRVGEGSANLGEPVGVVPAKSVPGMIREFVSLARDGENLADLVDRLGLEQLRELCEKHQAVPSLEVSPEYYQDF